MFRYGGPIKQGIMSGIREPHKNGGLSKQFNTGLVGDERYPKTDGREHHVAFIPPILAGLGVAGRFLARPFGSWAMKQIAKKGVTAGSGAGTIRSGLGRSRVMQPGESLTQSVNKFTPYKFWSEDPLVKAGMTGAGWTGKALKKGAGLAKWGVTTPSGLAMTLPGGFFYAKGKWWDKNNNPADPNDIAAAKANTGKKPWESNEGMMGDGSWFAAQAEKEANIAKQKEWNNRIKKYRDIMDIKGMNKEAAYKSLVDASKLIQESGDFKGDIRSGKLINQVIQAASKQFDKPAKTSDAINTLILQNELKKDLSAETDALDKEYKRSAIAINEKKLAGATLNEDIGAFRTKHGKNPSGAKLEGILLDKDVNVVDVADTVQVDKHIEGGGDEVSFMESIVEANVKKGKSVTPGVYVVKDKIIVIDENGNVTKKR